MSNITHNVTTETWLKTLLIFEGGFAALLIAQILVGNILTLIVVLQHRSLRRKNYLLIPSLAAADTLVGIGFALNLTQGQGIWCADYLTWTLSFMLLCYGLFLSHAHILAMAIQRFLAIVFPLKYGVWIIRKRMYVQLLQCGLHGLFMSCHFCSLTGEIQQIKSVSPLFMKISRYM